MATTKQISLKRKVIRSGLFKAELNEFLKRELAEDGYSDVQVRQAAPITEIFISATKTQNVLGEGSKRINELTSVVEKRFGFPAGGVILLADKIPFRGLSAVAQAESLKYRLKAGTPVRKACYGTLRSILEAGARGVEVVVSGKIKGQRAKAMKFCDGMMIHSGDPINYYISRATRHVLLPQGILGIKVKIMKQHDPNGYSGHSKPLPDTVMINQPKDEGVVGAPDTVDFANVQQ
ncbi:40S ribosomal protein S3 [Cichlidogyrus casuarinus]|uniref:Small ribosomal subunit protein uS3 n=1 Tax=Cichlidogyrus casuarinus TaxID=1844966 RepID=A0ABD2PNG6_9PLAT